MIGGAMVSLILLVGVAACVCGVTILMLAAGKIAKAQGIAHSIELERAAVQKEIAAEKREAAFQLKEELHKRRVEFKNELKREQCEFERIQSKLNAQKESFDEKERWINSTKMELQQKERELSRLSDQLRINQERAKGLQVELTSRLEKLAYMTQEEARRVLFEALEAEVKHSHEKWIQKAEEEARLTARERSLQIIVEVMQRYSSDYVSSNTICIVSLPNDDMKGRIIGKEGRNIKVLEMTTGVDIIIDDTPEIITISGFNPVRREIARRTLEKLVADGRINPTRIEETVSDMEREVDEIIQSKGKDAVARLNLHNVAQEIIILLGQLHFRTSFSQDVLAHSIEVATMARMLAEELGLPRPDLAARAGLLHDIGKAASSDHEGPHAQIGAEVARRCGEDPLVVNAIAAHHEEVPFKTLYDPLILIADTISAARPGARRETLAVYIKRLEKLEAIASQFSGVKRAYALQAGREIRIIVEEDILNDQDSSILALNVAKKVESELTFPGQIKVNVIREKRTIEYAK